MAQETAGTIGIPVLKNEILPYLTDYAKRQERAELYKQKAAAAAAQKAAKEEKPVELDQTQYVGAGYDKWLKESYDTDLAKAKAVMANPASTRQEKVEAAAIFKSGGEYRSKLTKQREDEWKNAVNDMNTRSLYTVPPTYYYEQTKDLPGVLSTQEIVTKAKSNPLQFLDFDKINKMSQGFAVRDVSLDEPGGQKKTQFKGSALFNYELVDDPNDVFVGKKVPVIKEVNGEVAKKFIAANPELQQAFNDWTKIKADEIIAAGNLAGTQVDPAKAEKMAVDEFLKKSFRDAPIQYGMNITPRTPRSGGVVGGTPPASTTGQSNYVAMPVYSMEKDKKTNREENLGEQNFEIGSASDKFWPITSKDHPAGVKVYLMMDDEEEDVQNSFNKANDGTYIAKRGFKYSNPTERTVFFAKNDIPFYNPDGSVKYKIKQGSPIDNTTGDKLFNDGRGSSVETLHGYDVTATMENGPVVRMFVPVGQDANIKAAIGKKK
jgi:hypothetical protein